jgi:hypothetical protein
MDLRASQQHGENNSRHNKHVLGRVIEPHYRNIVGNFRRPRSQSCNRSVRTHVDSHSNSVSAALTSSASVTTPQRCSETEPASASIFGHILQLAGRPKIRRRRWKTSVPISPTSAGWPRIARRAVARRPRRINSFNASKPFRLDGLGTPYEEATSVTDTPNSALHHRGHPSGAEALGADAGASCTKRDVLSWRIRQEKQTTSMTW